MQRLILTACLGCLLTVAPLTARASQVILSPAESEKYLADKAATHAAARAADKDPREWRTIKLQYGRPSWVAWWIDPANQSEPADFIESRKLLESVNARPLPKPPAAKPKGNSDLPVGVDEIKADDGQRTLSALASEKGLENLQKLVQFFDQPLRMVGINADIIETDEDSAKQLGGEFSFAEGPFKLDAGKPIKKGPVGLAFLRKDAQTALDKLIAEGNARIVASYQLTAKNNMPAGDTAVLEGIGEGGQKSGLLTLVATPTVNNDSTVTVVINLRGFDQPLIGSPPAIQTFSLQTIANIRNKDILMLTGLNFGDWEAPAAISPANPVAVRVKKLYLLLSPRILEGKRFQ